MRKGVKEFIIGTYIKNSIFFQNNNINVNDILCLHIELLQEYTFQYLSEFKFLFITIPFNNNNEFIYNIKNIENQNFSLYDIINTYRNDSIIEIELLCINNNNSNLLEQISKIINENDI